MNRYVTVSLTTGKAYLRMWVGTEDEMQFLIKAPKTKPYVMAYGVRYDLTRKEIESLKHQMKAGEGFRAYIKQKKSIGEKQ